MSPKTLIAKIRDNKDVIIRRTLIVGGVTAGAILAGHAIQRVKVRMDEESEYNESGIEILEPIDA